MSIRILVVDDEPAMCQLVSDALVIQNLEPVTANSADQAMEIVRSQDLDVVLTDVKMPGRTGLELCGELTDLRPELPVIVMTAFGTIDKAVEAMKIGAFDYLTKPLELHVVRGLVEDVRESIVEVERDKNNSRKRSSPELTVEGREQLLFHR